MPCHKKRGGGGTTIMLMDWQWEETQREKEKKEKPWYIKGERDEDKSREALTGEEGKMKGVLAACSPYQALSKDGLWANLLPLSLSFNHCHLYSLHSTHIFNLFL